MDTLTCPCGATLPLHYRFCTDCGATAPPLPDLTGPAAQLEPRAESALRHVLRDILDGHVGVWLPNEDGRPLADRHVPAALSRFDWVAEMVSRGWLIPDRAAGRPRLVPTDTARDAFQAGQ